MNYSPHKTAQQATDYKDVSKSRDDLQVIDVTKMLTSLPVTDALFLPFYRKYRKSCFY